MRINQLHNPAAALQFVVEFAQQADLATASMRRVGQIERQLDAVLNPDRPAAWHRVPRIDRPTLLTLQAEVLALLTNIAERGMEQVELRLTFWVARELRADARNDARAVRDSTAYVPDVGVLVYGPVRDWLLYRVIQLTLQTGAGNLRSCPDCGRIFFKVTRKEYCSTRCQSRVYMRKYRAGEVGR